MAIIQSGEEKLQQTSPEQIINSDGPVNFDFQNGDEYQSEDTQSYGGIATPTIINQAVPVVLFVGPPSSGKSMILVRLAKYLRTKGYSIRTDPTFLNTPQYQEGCLEFEDCLNTTVALSGTVKFLLVDVYDGNGNLIAKLLEAPGEDFYTTDSAKIKAGKNRQIESYLGTIMTSKNPKSYVVLLDLDSDTSFRRDGFHRSSYEQRILSHFYPAINKNRDRVILLYNKIDMTPFGDINGCNNHNGALNDAKNFYPAWFSTMKVSKMGGFITADNFSFKTFCTGMFATQTDNFGNQIKTYNIASDVYPGELWKEIISKW